MENTDTKVTEKKENIFDISKIVEVAGIKQDKTEILLEKQAGLENSDPDAKKKAGEVPSLEEFEKEINPDVGEKKDEEAKEYKVGGKQLSKSEMVTKLNEHFENKYNFSDLDDESFKKYADLYSKAFDGQRKEDWQKSLGTRENALAVEKKAFISERQSFEQEKAKLQALADLSDEDIEDDYDLTMVEKQRKINQKLKAEERLSEIEMKEKQMKAEESAMQFAELHYHLANKYPELRTSVDIREVFRKHNAKQKVDKNDVKVAYTVYKILNDADEYGFADPNEFYDVYGDNYRANLNGINSSKDNSEIRDKAEKLKEKQDRQTGIPPGSQPVNPNPSSRMELIPGKSETEKLNAIMMNKR